MPSIVEKFEQVLDEARPEAARALGEARVDAFRGGARARFVALEPSLPRFESSVNTMFFTGGPQALAIYRTLRDDMAMERDPALALTEEVLTAFMTRKFMNPLVGPAMTLALRIGPIRRLVLKKQLEANDDANASDGFRFETVDDPEALAAFDVHECGVAKFAQQHGAPEIVPIICQLDDVMASALRGIELRRTGTIGRGAARCDFRYVRVRRSKG
jgi:L-2-amino-thiazoline-4-carboxylic acid hydrolase-like protein